MNPFKWIKNFWRHRIIVPYLLWREEHYPQDIIIEVPFSKYMDIRESRVTAILVKNEINILATIRFVYPEEFFKRGYWTYKIEGIGGFKAKDVCGWQLLRLGISEAEFQMAVEYNWEGKIVYFKKSN